MPRWCLIRSQVHPAQVLNERRCVGVRLRGAETEHRIAFLEMIMMATLDMPSPGCTSLAGTVIPAQRSPMLGELVVMVSWVSGREEDHVIAIAEGHELQTPELDHRSQRKWMFGVSHLEKWQESNVDTQRPLPGASTVDVWTREGPKPMSEFVLRAPYSGW
jgi:hypothetical protein